MKHESPFFVWPIRVYYEDTDAGGVVYYANYLNFMERGRTEWLRKMGIEHDDMMQEDGVILAVRQVEVGYLKPARMNDALEITSSMLAKGRASMSIYQEVIRASDSEVLCRGKVKIACLDKETMTPTTMPKKLMMGLPDVD